MTQSKSTIKYAIVIAAALALMLSSSFITPALAANPRSNPSNPVTCSASPAPGSPTRTLTCSGKISGLGNVQQVTAQLVADVITDCTNKPGHKPPGHIEVLGTPQSLHVENGQVTFTLSVAVSANCPPPQAGSVGTFISVAILIHSTAIRIPGTF